MNPIAKGVWFAVATSLLSVASLTGATENTQLRNLENRVSALEQRKGSNGMINPPARPVVQDGVDLFLQGDVILWQATQTGLEYGVKNYGKGSSLLNSYVQNGQILSPHFAWDWGFKLAAGYNLPHDGWDLFLQWTRFYTNNNEHGTTAPAGGTIFPTFVNSALPLSDLLVPGLGLISSGFDQASMYWHLKLNLLDLELGKEYYVSKWLTMRPHAGLRSAWLRQHMHMNYSGGFTSLTSPNQTISVHMKNNFWGMGLRGGLDGNWGLSCGFSLFSDLAASILLGHFSVTQYEFDTAVSPASTRLNADESFRAARSSLDMDVGLRYKHDFACNAYALMIQLGWEQHLFFNQNQLKKFVGTNDPVLGPNYSGLFTTSQGDLNTQGVTLSVKFDF